MSSKRAGVAALAVVLVGAAGFLGWQWWRAPARGGGDEQSGARALSAGIIAGMRAAENLLEPYRCARPDQESASHPQTLRVGAGTERREAHLSGHTLRLAVANGRPVRVAVVADARGAVEHLAAVREHLAALPTARSVDLVVSLGGLARDREGIETALAALTGPWFVVAVPGDWESYGDHRAAVAALADEGVVDGASARVIQLADAALFLTLPGVSHQARSLAGVDACVYSDEDVAGLSGLVPAAGDASEPPRILLTHAPPRQHGLDATDRSPAGVHMGEPALTRALAEAGIGLAIHGLVVRGEDRPGDRRVPLDPARPTILSAGAADGIADIGRGGTRPPTALMITLASGSVTWRYLEK